MKSKIILVLTINAFVLFFFNFAHPVTPEMLSIKGMLDSANGILYAFMSLGMVVLSPIFGTIINRVDKKIIMIISVIGYALSQQIFCYGNTLEVMSLGRFLSGGMAAGWIVASASYVNDLSNEHNRTKYFAYIMVSNAVGGIFGQLFSGFIGLNNSYQEVFTFQMLGLMIICISMIFLKDTKPKALIKENIKKNVSKVESLKVIMFSIVLTLLFSTAFNSLNSEIGYFVDSAGGSTFDVGFINGYVSAITLVVNLFFVNYIYNRLTSKYYFIFSSVFSILGIVLFLYTDLNFIIKVTMMFIGLVSFRPVLQKIAVENDEISSSVSIGLINSANSVGMVLGGLISGILYGISSIYILYFVLCILVVILAISVINNLNSDEF